jgi:beta-1,4-N-acetylglucosaminyltransferase
MFDNDFGAIKMEFKYASTKDRCAVRKMRILVVLGEGGHTKELLALLDLIEEDYQYGYLIIHDDEISENKILKSGPVFRVARPRYKEFHLIKDVLNTLRCFWESFLVLRRFHPNIVLSSGPAVAIPVSVLSRLSRIKVIFIETGSRVSSLSLTGKIMYRLAHLFFVQWPGLEKRYPKSIYAGRLL